MKFVSEELLDIAIFVTALLLLEQLCLIKYLLAFRKFLNCSVISLKSIPFYKFYEFLNYRVSNNDASKSVVSNTCTSDYLEVSPQFIIYCQTAKISQKL